MTLHAPSSVESVSFNPEVGGCGKEHAAKKGERLSVTCAPCEQLISKYHVGWGATPAQAALTEAEEAAKEADFARGQALLAAAGTALGENIAAVANAPKTTGRKAKV